MWSNSIAALATVTLARPQSAEAVALWLPACLSARDNLGCQTRGDSNSLSLSCHPPFARSRCVRLRPLPVRGLDEVLVGSSASVKLHYYEFIHAHMSPPSFSSFPKSPFPPSFCHFLSFSILPFSSLSPSPLFPCILSPLSLASSSFLVPLSSLSIPAPNLFIRPSLSCLSRLSEELWLVSLKWFFQNFKGFTSKSWGSASAVEKKICHTWKHR